MQKILIGILFSLIGVVGVVGFAQQPIIRISTDNVDLILSVAENRQLYQTYLGEKLTAMWNISLLPGDYLMKIGLSCFSG